MAGALRCAATHVASSSAGTPRAILRNPAQISERPICNSLRHDAATIGGPCSHFHFISNRSAHKRVWGAACSSCGCSARLQLGAYRAGVGVAALPALVVAGVGIALYKPTVAALGAAKDGIEKLEALHVKRREASEARAEARARAKSARGAALTARDAELISRGIDREFAQV